jgi:tryptophan 2,3-dioxygenase
LRPEHIEQVRNAEGNKSLLDLVNSWLERMPFFNDRESWIRTYSNSADEADNDVHPFWKEYRRRYSESLDEAEKENLSAFDEIFSFRSKTRN